MDDYLSFFSYSWFSIGSLNVGIIGREDFAGKDSSLVICTGIDEIN